MNLVTIDFETYYDTGYSLSNMSFMEYIRDPRFEVLSCSIKLNDEAAVTHVGGAVGPALKAINWATSAAVAHNGNEFDFPLLVWVYDCHPKLFIDTLCLSRPKHQSEVGGSLKTLSEAYGLPQKQVATLENMRGKRLADLDLRQMAALASYNDGDTNNCYSLSQIFSAPDLDDDLDLRDVVKANNWYKKELRLSDMTARMICYPKFVCDDKLLIDTAEKAEAEKIELLTKVAFDLNLLDHHEVLIELGSSAKFAKILRGYGVEPPMKISKTTGKETYAFAKTDEEFLALREHPDPVVANLVEARLGAKSTLLETRIQKMLACSQAMDGAMPIPLAYHAATTGRWGGRVWNPQNLPRINPKQPKLTDALRKALKAPPGHKVVVSDLSGIELRVNHYLWGVESSAELYAKDPQADLYIDFASFMYNVPPEDVTKDQRQLAKVAQLGLGFGAGAPTFQRVAKIMGGIALDSQAAAEVVVAWRQKYNDIVHGWFRCQQAVSAMHAGSVFYPDQRRLVRTGRNKVYLPSGRVLHYPDLRVDTDAPKARGLQYVYGTGRKTSKIYSGLMDENFVQAIARDVIAEQALKIWMATGYHPAHTVHDELIYIVPEAKAEQHLATINHIMRTPPAWLPGIVLWSEGDIADNYGDAK